MTMLERVAEALYKHEQGERTLDECMLLARAAIESLMEPDEVMIRGGLFYPGTEEDVKNTIKYALKAVLEGK